MLNNIKKFTDEECAIIKKYNIAWITYNYLYIPSYTQMAYNKRDQVKEQHVTICHI